MTCPNCESEDYYDPDCENCGGSGQCIICSGDGCIECDEGTCRDCDGSGCVDNGTVVCENCGVEYDA